MNRALLLLAAAPAVALTMLGNITAKPSAQQLEWHACEIGVMITFNWQAACTRKGSNTTSQQCQKGSQATGAPLYLPSLGALHTWSLPDLDTDAWMAAAASFGAKYAILVVDHMSGFTLWPTAMHNISVAATAWKGGRGDIVADYRASAAAAGIKPGLFYSTHYNWVLGVNNYAVGWPRLYGGAPLSQSEYERLVIAQLDELMDYGPWFELWFDGGVNNTATPGVGPWIRANATAAGALCHSCSGFTEADPSSPGRDGRGIRWMGNEEGAMPLPSWGAVNTTLTPFNGDPQGAIYAPGSCDTVTSEHYWFWQGEMDEPQYRRSSCALLNVYLTSVGRASNLMLNMAPTDAGGVDPVDAAAYAALGDAIACLWSVPLGAAGGAAGGGGSGGGGGNITLTVPTGNASAPASAVLPWQPIPSRTQPCSASAAGSCGVWNVSVVVQEELSAAGQRIGDWSIDACIATTNSSSDSECVTGTWYALTSPAIQPLAIGHKRIAGVVLEAPLSGGDGSTLYLTALRVNVQSAYVHVDAPDAPLQLTSLALFDRSPAAIGSCLPAGCTLVTH